MATITSFALHCIALHFYILYCALKSQYHPAFVNGRAGVGFCTQTELHLFIYQITTRLFQLHSKHVYSFELASYKLFRISVVGWTESAVVPALNTPERPKEGYLEFLLATILACLQKCSTHEVLYNQELSKNDFRGKAKGHTPVCNPVYYNLDTVVLVVSRLLTAIKRFISIKLSTIQSTNCFT